MSPSLDRRVRRSDVFRGGLSAAVCLALCLVPGSAVGAARTPETPGTPLSMPVSTTGWLWPADRFRIERPYMAPPHEYGPGHRGIDLELLDDPSLRAPANGVVAFAGTVAGRGILTIDHGAGLVTTLEPVITGLTPGAVVARGDDVAELSTGGHAGPGIVHFGVRQDGRYINPLLLLGGVPRAVLLPCCD